MNTNNCYVRYVYKKYKNLPIPYGHNGKIIFDYKHNVTSKLLIDFKEYGKAIVPESAIERI